MSLDRAIAEAAQVGAVNAAEERGDKWRWYTGENAYALAMAFASGISYDGRWSVDIDHVYGAWLVTFHER